MCWSFLVRLGRLLFYAEVLEEFVFKTVVFLMQQPPGPRWEGREGEASRPHSSSRDLGFIWTDRGGVLPQNPSGSEAFPLQSQR